MTKEHKPKLLTTLSVLAVALAASTVISGPANAHHSFAVYDFETEIAFEGMVETVNFKNPHIAMTLAYEDENGEKKIAHFVEGAPANMLIRKGFDPAWLEPGSKITAVGSPRYDDTDAMFLKAVILEDGSEFRAVGP